MRASGAWMLPACLCSIPERARMNTSNSGHSLRTSLIGTSSGRGLRRLLLASVGERGIANPLAVVVRSPARLETLAVAWAVALEHPVELGPVDRTEPVMLRLLVPAQLGIGDLETEELGLRRRDVDELLAQLVVGKALDLPAHRLSSVLRVRVGRTEHHDRRPPPAVERTLRHRLLFRRAARQRHHDLEALPLVEALFLADAHHRARVRAVRAAADRDLVH